MRAKPTFWRRLWQHLPPAASSEIDVQGQPSSATQATILVQFLSRQSFVTPSRPLRVHRDETGLQNGGVSAWVPRMGHVGSLIYDLIGECDSVLR